MRLCSVFLVQQVQCNYMYCSRLLQPADEKACHFINRIFVWALAGHWSTEECPGQVVLKLMLVEWNVVCVSVCVCWQLSYMHNELFVLEMKWMSTLNQNLLSFDINGVRTVIMNCMCIPVATTCAAEPSCIYAWNGKKGVSLLCLGLIVQCVLQLESLTPPNFNLAEYSKLLF